MNVINKDVLTPVIQESLLSAEQLGRAQMRVFVDKRLCEPVDSDQHMDLKSHIQNNKAKTFAFLYEVVQPSKGKAKAYQSGQEHPTKAYRANVTLYETSCLLIDGQGLVMELGNPLDIRTIGAKLRRIDLVFDRYQGESIKTGTKAKRKQRHRPVRRKIENEVTVPLPSNWSSLGKVTLIENSSISSYIDL